MTKFGLFGAGFIGQVHGANLAAHPTAEPTYVYDLNTVRQSSWRHESARERLCQRPQRDARYSQALLLWVRALLIGEIATVHGPVATREFLRRLMGE